MEHCETFLSIKRNTTKSMAFKLRLNTRYTLDDGNEYVLIGTTGNETESKNKCVVLVDDVNWKRKKLKVEDFFKQVK